MVRSAASRRVAAAAAALAVGLLGGGPASAGGLLFYEFGTAEVGLAAAGYAARAQDASTAFTNPAGMTRLEGTQALAGGQLMWLNQKFSIGSGTSPALGGNDGGRALGSNGFVPGAGAFVSHSLTRDLKVGFSIAGNFGSMLDCDDDWVGRYRVQQATILGVQFVPSVAWRVNDRLSVGAGLNAVYGIFDQKVAINNVSPLIGDGRLELDDRSWGFGGNVGLLYDVTPDTRFGLTWTSEVDLDFKAPARFSSLGPALSALLASRGLLDADVSLGTRIPQQVMASVYSRIDERWAVLGNVGWQQWSHFGRVAVGIDSNDPVGLTTNLEFKDTWHVALGTQYQLSAPWTLSAGVAYDSAFQDSANVAVALPTNAVWRFGAGAQKRESPTFAWGASAEWIYGGDLDVDLRSRAPVALGGRGDLVGSFADANTFFFSVNLNWKF